MQPAHATVMSPEFAQERPQHVLDDLQELHRRVTKINAGILEKRKEHRGAVTEQDARFKKVITKMCAGIHDAEAAVAGASDKIKGPEFYAYELLLVSLIGITAGLEFLRQSHQDVTQSSAG